MTRNDDEREETLRIPIVRYGNNLIISIQTEVHDEQARELQIRVLEEIDRTGSKGVFFDISVLDTVDSYIGRMLYSLASMAAIMDAAVVVVGMQPAVAITLVELGLKMPGVYTALNINEGIKMLNRRRKKRREKPHASRRPDHGRIRKP